jgi:hypothetical protein
MHRHSSLESKLKGMVVVVLMVVEIFLLLLVVVVFVVGWNLIRKTIVRIVPTPTFMEYIYI